VRQPPLAGRRATRLGAAAVAAASLCLPGIATAKPGGILVPFCTAEGPRLISIPLAGNGIPVAPPSMPEDEAPVCAHAVRARAPSVEEPEE
jgi:hypothetical protein